MTSCPSRAPLGDKNRPEASQHSSALSEWGINPLYFTDLLKQYLNFNAASDHGCSLYMVDGVIHQIRKRDMKRWEAREMKWRVPVFGGFTDGYSTSGAQLVLFASRASQQNIYYVNKSSDKNNDKGRKCSLNISTLFILFGQGKIKRLFPQRWMWTDFNTRWSVVHFAVYNDFIVFHAFFLPRINRPESKFWFYPKKKKKIQLSFNLPSCWKIQFFAPTTVTKRNLFPH